MFYRRILWTLALTPISGGGAYFFKRVFEGWGVLDYPADLTGGWIKMNATPAAYDVLGLVLFLALYVSALWFMWRHTDKIRTIPIEPAPAATSGENAKQPDEEGDPFIPLSDAAYDAYEKTFGTSLAHDAETYAQSANRSETDLREFYAQYLMGYGCPIYGSRPPSKEVVRLPDDISSKGNPVDGGTNFRLYADREPTYTSLQIRRSDLNAVVQLVLDAQLIPLKDAALEAWEAVEESAFGRVVSKLLTNGRDEMPGVMARKLVERGALTLYGTHPPSRMHRELGKDVVLQFSFSDDGSALHEKMGKDAYYDLQIRKTDFERLKAEGLAKLVGK